MTVTEMWRLLVEVHQELWLQVHREGEAGKYLVCTTDKASEIEE